jgi:hypothetical protein
MRREKNERGAFFNLFGVYLFLSGKAEAIMS